MCHKLDDWNSLIEYKPFRIKTDEHYFLLISLQNYTINVQVSYLYKFIYEDNINNIILILYNNINFNYEVDQLLNSSDNIFEYFW